MSMPLDLNDPEDVKLLSKQLTSDIMNKLEPYINETREISQVVFGAASAKEPEGLVSDVKEMKEKVNNLQLNTAKITGGIIIVALLAKEIISKLFFGGH